MYNNNEPREFVLTPENYLETLMEWMPGQLERMRFYEAGPIKTTISSTDTLVCQYMQTVGGEKFRLFDMTHLGASGSVYYEPRDQDDDVILAYAKRLQDIFAFMARAARVIKRPMELRMVFEPGPFEAPR